MMTDDPPQNGTGANRVREGISGWECALGERRNAVTGGVTSDAVS